MSPPRFPGENVSPLSRFPSSPFHSCLPHHLLWWRFSLEPKTKEITKPALQKTSLNHGWSGILHQRPRRGRPSNSLSCPGLNCLNRQKKRETNPLNISSPDELCSCRPSLCPPTWLSIQSGNEASDRLKS